LKEYTFSDSVPDGYTFDFEQAFFNLDAFLNHQGHNRLSFYVLQEKRSAAVASIHFHFMDSRATSPLSAPFGSFDASHNIPVEVLFDFIGWVDEQLRLKSMTRVVIKCPPQEMQGRNGQMISVFLLNHGYKICSAETGALITVGQNPFEGSIDPWEQRKIRQAKEKGMEARTVSLEMFHEVYKLIADSRAKKNYKLSMEENKLRDVISSFPDRFNLFGVFDKTELVSASIAIRVKQDILYNFYSDHHEKYDHLSPVVMLIREMYQYCMENGVTILDLGTSAIEDKPNFGLLDFKLRLGGKATPKLTFEKYHVQ
jgi:hypothetical protein